MPSSRSSRPPHIEGLATRSVTVEARDVVFLKRILEAHDGLAQVYAESGGDLVIAFPGDREPEVASLLADLAGEIAMWERAAP